jgi:hypothetical protein
MSTVKDTTTLQPTFIHNFKGNQSDSGIMGRQLQYKLGHIKNKNRINH